MSAPIRLSTSRAGTQQRFQEAARTRGAMINLSEVLAALSHALDITEGLPVGHTVRTCVIGMRIAEALGLDALDRSALYYALLLKDSGCSSNAGRMSALFGSDDRSVKQRMKFVNWHHRVHLAINVAKNAGIGRPLLTRARHFFRMAGTESMARELVLVRCDRGAEIARQLGFPDATADAIRSLDEHWCGKGYPDGTRGADIPLLSRIANIAQTVEVFHTEYGLDEALHVARARRGTWFDPALVDMVLGWRNDIGWWESLGDPEVANAAIAAEPAESAWVVDEAGLDTVARAFAEIIDAKSPYTFRHSFNVATYASAIGARLGLDAAEQRRLHRAGLLHDIGKLGVSNGILDKPAALTPEERSEVERHPSFTWDILSRVSAFGDFAWTAALHHEKLDGSGYPWKLDARHLDLPARILGVADIYEALTADRPYRAGMPKEAAFAILRREAGTKVCATSVDALDECARGTGADGSALAISS